ncbi:hypothetical protein [Archangium primigenium]|uniref:hypothetical protein n=1 Tax=[Archangium] primigenium TaxID=2792470 RepID=UPI001957DE71|nr:hypothetical protein [Archangium primigenium]MBM7118536.1 hypothetical protein [Archangium primigenium]
MNRALLLIACLLPLACSSRKDASPPDRPGPGPEVWVDGTRGEAGEGSRTRPWRSLAEALARADGPRPPRIHLAPGAYPGPFVLPAGAEVVGEGAVLVGGGEGPVVRAAGGALLRGLTLQGGAWGLEAAGGMRLEAVRFQGQREGGVSMGAGDLTVEGSRFEAGGPGTVGLRIDGARARVRDTVFTGAFRRALEARDAEVDGEALRVEGAATGLHQSRGRVVLRQVTVTPGPEVGLFVDHGTLRLEDVTVTGHEYGVQALQGTLETRGLTSLGAVRAGVSLVGARGELVDTRVRGSGNFGAVSLVGSDTVLRGLRVEDAEAYGLTATRGTVRLSRALFTGLTSREGDSGDGLHLRDVDVEARGLVVRGAAGVGVLAAQGARVVLRDASLEACHEAGVWSETLARVSAERLRVQDAQGPALVVLENGVLHADGLVAERNAGGLAAAADCTGGTRVTFHRVVGEGLVGPAVPCVGEASR